MKTCITIVCLFCVSVISGVVLAGDETNRFHGATCDGYDQASYIQTSGTNSYPLINARFTGGNYDGYDLTSATNLSVVVQGQGGTLFLFR